MELNERIASYRKDLGLTQEGLAQQLGVTNQAVSKWESGQSCPDIALLPLLADLFGVTIDALFGRQSPPSVNTDLPWADDGTLRLVLYAGHALLAKGQANAGELRFRYEGPAQNIECACALQCDDVYGNVHAEGSVTCDDVYGNVHAGGNVTVDEVTGDIRAGGNVTVDEASGSITAGGNVHCDHWER